MSNTCHLASETTTSELHSQCVTRCAGPPGGRCAPLWRGTCSGSYWSCCPHDAASSPVATRIDIWPHHQPLDYRMRDPSRQLQEDGRQGSHSNNAENLKAVGVCMQVLNPMLSSTMGWSNSTAVARLPLRNNNNKCMCASCLAASNLLSVSEARAGRQHLPTLNIKVHARGVCADRVSAIRDALVTNDIQFIVIASWSPRLYGLQRYNEHDTVVKQSAGVCRQTDMYMQAGRQAST